MIQIVGNSAKKVELKDLNDVVFFKQQKSFSDSDYNSSMDLKREIANGRLIVLKRTDDIRPTNDGYGFNLESSDSLKEATPVKTGVAIDEPKTTRSDEGIINKSPNIDPAIFDTLVGILEGKFESQMGSLKDSLEARFFKADSETFNRKIDELIGLVKSGSSLSPRAVSSSIPDTKTTSIGFTDEVYVPSIKVEDGNAHISLKTRVIDGGSQGVSNALDALKSLKK